MDKNSLCTELKGVMRSLLDMPNLELDNDTDLINSGLDIDSLDILELELALEKKYDIQDALPRESLRSIDSIADFIINYKRTH